MAHVIEKLDVSLGAIMRLLQAAGLSVLERSSGGIWVDHDGTRVTLELDEQYRLIRFQAMAPLKLKWGVNKHQLVSELNSNIVFIKCRVAGEVHLAIISEYFLSYEDDLLTEQLITSYLLFRQGHVLLMKALVAKGCNNWQ